MTKHLLSLVLVLLSALTLAAPVMAAGLDNGRIEGNIVNGTAGSGESLNNIEVILKTYVNDAETGTTKSARTDSGGKFVFDKVATGPENSYEAAATYKDVEYKSDRISFAAGETSKAVRLTVYETTTTGEAIQVMMAHSVVYSGQGKLQIRDYYLFVNNSDRTFVGSKEVAKGKKEVLKFPLPQDATQVEYAIGFIGSSVVNAGQGIIDTMPFLPGEKEMAYSYEVSYTSGSYRLNYPIYYPVGRYDFLYQGEGIQVKADRLKAEEPLNIQGASYSHLSGDNLVPGDSLVIELSNLSGGEAGGRGIAIPVALTLTVLSAGAGFIFLRRRQSRPVSLPRDSQGDQQGLLTELARLDDDFEAGKIPETEYQRVRAETKARLVGLMEKDGGE